MPLPSADSPISRSSLYPDAITLNFRYRIPRATFTNVANVLVREFHFRRVRRGNRVRGRLNFGRPTEQASADHSQQVTITRPNVDAPLCVFVTINPLSVLHRQRNDYGGERGRNRATNWAHPDDLQEDNTYISELATMMVWRFEVVLSELAEQLARRLHPFGYATSEGVTLSGIEIALDVAASDPHALVESWAPTLWRRFNRTVDNRYGGSASGYSERNGEQLLVAGFAGPDERVKLYEKTNRRVRLECEFRKLAFPRYGVRRRTILHDEGLDLGPLIERMAEAALPHFQSILSSCQQRPPERGEPPEVFFANVCNRTNKPQRAIDLVRILMRHGQIRRMFDRGFIKRLENDGILVRLRHGFSGVAQAYECAVERLRRLDEEWRGFLAGMVA